jgi:hypothetical protein
MGNAFIGWGCDDQRAGHHDKPGVEGNNTSLDQRNIPWTAPSLDPPTASFAIPNTMTRITLVVAVVILAIHFNGHPTALCAQPKQSTQAAEKEPKGEEIYIPKDLDDCFAQLKKMLSKEEVEKMKNGREDDMILYHHGLGMWLRNNWGLWKGSRLSKWFNGKGIQHPDDMSGIIFDSFWRHLNNKPIKLDEQVKHYQDYWKKAGEDREAREKKEKKEGKKK